MTENKTSSTADRYVDHPAPSAGLAFGFIAAIWVVLFGLTMISIVPADEIATGIRVMLYIVIILSAGTLAFYFWPMYTTYYTIETTGITVRYGPWKHTYPWEDFERAFWQRGMFQLRIGWPSITPCVRLTDAVVFKRRKGWSLYITPNDSREFLKKVSLFAESLTREAIF